MIVEPESKSRANKYRSDIDGLRAVAVLSVIIFHINEQLIPGGFVGVDIFFVISGYLISLHIFRDLNRSRFSILEFYGRRVKRIAPAMLTVVFITFLVSQVILLPKDAENVAESGLWSLLSMANVYFWHFHDTSYFAAASHEAPLLHLWSLGVEEQFYIFWPIILMYTFRIGHGKIFFCAISMTTIASFLLGEFLYPYDASFTYYMLPTRTGELLLGALLAQLLLNKGNEEIPKFMISLTAFLGVILIVGSLFLLSSDSIFPGLNAFPPTFGAVLLIFSGHYGQCLPIRMLTVKPMIFVGLVSYSAYLWHWPILALYRYGNSEITLVAGLLIFSLTFLLATLSYQYIEKPGRTTQRSTVQVIVLQFLIPTATIAFLCLVAMKIDGYGLRYFFDEYQRDLTKLHDEVRPAYEYDYVCQSQLLTEMDVNDPDCIVGIESESPPDAILWGDSNAAHYVGIVGQFAKTSGFSFRNMQIGSCPPINVDVADLVSSERVSDCNESRVISWQTVMKYKFVMISADWTSYYLRSNNFMRDFFNTVDALVREDKHVILIGKAPVFSGYDRRCKQKSLSYPLDITCDAPSSPLDPQVEKLNEKLKAFSSKSKNVDYIDFNNYLCPNGECSMSDSSGNIMYFDSSHLSLPASWRIGLEIVNEDGVPYPFTQLARQ